MENLFKIEPNNLALSLTVEAITAGEEGKRQLRRFTHTHQTVKDLHTRQIVLTIVDKEKNSHNIRRKRKSKVM